MWVAVSVLHNAQRIIDSHMTNLLALAFATPLSQRNIKVQVAQVSEAESLCKFMVSITFPRINALTSGLNFQDNSNSN